MGLGPPVASMAGASGVQTGLEAGMMVMEMMTSKLTMAKRRDPFSDSVAVEGTRTRRREGRGTLSSTRFEADSDHRRSQASPLNVPGMCIDAKQEHR